MFERYTEGARRAIFFARDEALQRGASFIETRDLILGLARDKHPSGSPLERLHDDGASLRPLLLDPSRLGEPSPHKDLQLTPDAKKALGYAADEANLDHRNHIDVEHLLRGILLVGDDTSPILKQAGYNLFRLRDASREPQADTSDSSTPTRPRLRRLLVPLALILLALIVVLIARSFQ